MSSRKWTKRKGGLSDELAEPDDAMQPRLRIVARWVPLYAAQSCLRQSRLTVNIAGIGISVINKKPRVRSCAL